MRYLLSAIACLPIAVAAMPTALQAQIVPTSPSPTSVKTGGGVCASQLPDLISRTIDRPQFGRVYWGIDIRERYTGVQLYARNHNRFFVPASNVKLFTTAAALRKLGANTRLRTSIYLRENPAGSPSLIVVGRGDPTLAERQLNELVEQIVRRGIVRFDRLIVDDGYFQGSLQHPDWEWGDLVNDYAPPIGSIVWRQNATRLYVLPQGPGRPVLYRWQDPIAGSFWGVQNGAITDVVGSNDSVGIAAILGKSQLQILGRLPANSRGTSFDVAIVDPSQTFARHLQAALARRRVTINSLATNGNESLANLPEIATIESPTILELVNETNLNSNNLFAEILLRTLGKTQSINAEKNTAELGLQIVTQNAVSLGLSANDFRLSDGSGLSRQNLASPSALVRLLTAMAESSEGNNYRNSLPISGVSGTLSNRFKNTTAVGRIRAKTGTLNSTVSLSGYAEPINYNPLVFSIIVNHSDRPTIELRQAIDELAATLITIRRC
jgi:D-alanyl-D-alanine carboxypeptidase/D-alanyl-D-alanine-endopeptidase (penicillin-binding protein 4)